MSTKSISSKATKNSKNSNQVANTTKSHKASNPQYNDEGVYSGTEFNHLNSLHGFLQQVAEEEQTNKIEVKAGCTRHFSASKDGSTPAFDAEGALIKIDGEAVFFLTYSSQVQDEDPSASELFKGSKDQYAVYERVEADSNDNPILVLGKPQDQGMDIDESDDSAEFTF